MRKNPPVSNMERRLVSKEKKVSRELHVNQFTKITTLMRHQPCKAGLMKTNPHELKEKNQTGKRHSDKESVHLNHLGRRMVLIHFEVVFGETSATERIMSEAMHMRKYKRNAAVLSHENTFSKSNAAQ